jgi:polysaccharide export outer membrane protein
MGAVEKPGCYSALTGPLTLLDVITQTGGAKAQPHLISVIMRSASGVQALGVVGGLQQATADPAGVFVFRRAGFDQNDKPIAQIFRLDMSRPESIMIASAFRLQADDALYVTNAGIYEAQKVIAPIVQMIILGNTVTGQ